MDIVPSKSDTLDDGDSILMAQRLAREFGLGVGISSAPSRCSRSSAVTRL